MNKNKKDVVLEEEVTELHGLLFERRFWGVYVWDLGSVTTNYRNTIRRDRISSSRIERDPIKVGIGDIITYGDMYKRGVEGSIHVYKLERM